MGCAKIKSLDLDKVIGFAFNVESIDYNTDFNKMLKRNSNYNW